MFTPTAPILERKFESKAEMKDADFWKVVAKLEWCNRAQGVIRNRGPIQENKKVTEKAKELAQQLHTSLYRDNVMEYLSLRTKKRREVISHILARGQTYYEYILMEPLKISELLPNEYQKCRHYYFDQLN